MTIQGWFRDGLNEMEPEQAKVIYFIITTGCEPLTHPRVFDILDIIEAYGLKFTLGTNAVLVDDRCAERHSESYQV
jgi:MoaA/NifB/PqqE/SkfB family radical SAM enzyme